MMLNNRVSPVTVVGCGQWLLVFQAGRERTRPVVVASFLDEVKGVDLACLLPWSLLDSVLPQQQLVDKTCALDNAQITSRLHHMVADGLSLTVMID